MRIFLWPEGRVEEPTTHSQRVKLSSSLDADADMYSDISNHESTARGASSAGRGCVVDKSPSW